MAVGMAIGIRHRDINRARRVRRRRDGDIRGTVDGDDGAIIVRNAYPVASGVTMSFKGT